VKQQCEYVGLLQTTARSAVSATPWARSCVHVAHAQHDRLALQPRLGADVRGVGVPGEVHVAGHERIHEPLVVGVEDVVDVEPALREVGPEALPDGDHPRVVRDGADEQRAARISHGAPSRK
jgi:hypothetical protein